MAEILPKIGPEISGKIAFRYPKHRRVERKSSGTTRNPHQAQIFSLRMKRGMVSQARCCLHGLYEASRRGVQNAHGGRWNDTCRKRPLPKGPQSLNALDVL